MSLQCRAPLLGALLLLAFLLLPPPLAAQRGRRGGGGGSSVQPVPIKGVIISFHGRLKQLEKKIILLEGDDARLVTFHRNGKTKFWASEKEVKAADVDLETVVTVDAVEDNDLKFLAVAVKVDPQQEKRALTPESK